MANLPMFLLDEEEDQEDRRNPEEVLVEGPQNVEPVEPPGRIRVPRQFRDPVDLLHVSDAQLLRYYRFPRNEILEICDIVRPTMERATRRSHALPLVAQVLACLRFLASGSFQHILGDTVHISQSSCSRIFKAFCERIAEVADEFIKFPLNDAEYVTTVKQGFYQIAEFPNIIGCIDGTHIRIKKPEVNPENYRCRKVFYSLNVQLVCDSNLKISSICVRWPGSTHDGFIWEQSGLKEALEQWDGIGWLIGDSGYPCERRLLTPFRNPGNIPEQRYNTSHTSTRNPIERCIGVWKSRFRCLDTSGGTLLYSVEKARNIIITASVLHNLCTDRRIYLNDEELIVVERNDDDIADNIYPNDLDGIRARRDVVDRFFT